MLLNSFSKSFFVELLLSLSLSLLFVAVAVCVFVLGVVSLLSLSVLRDPVDDNDESSLSR